MDNIGNVCHAVITTGVRIYDMNDKISPPLEKEYLDLIFGLYHDYERVEEFEKVFYAIKYVNSKSKKKYLR